MYITVIHSAISYDNDKKIKKKIKKSIRIIIFNKNVSSLSR